MEGIRSRNNRERALRHLKLDSWHFEKPRSAQPRLKRQETAKQQSRWPRQQKASSVRPNKSLSHQRELHFDAASGTWQERAHTGAQHQERAQRNLNKILTLRSCAASAPARRELGVWTAAAFAALGLPAAATAPQHLWKRAWRRLDWVRRSEREPARAGLCHGSAHAQLHPSPRQRPPGPMVAAAAPSALRRD